MSWVVPSGEKWQGKDLTTSVLSPNQTPVGARRGPPSCMACQLFHTILSNQKEKGSWNDSGLCLCWIRISVLNYTLAYTPMPEWELWAMGRGQGWQRPCHGGAVRGEPITGTWSKSTVFVGRAWQAGNSGPFGCLDPVFEERRPCSVCIYSILRKAGRARGKLQTKQKKNHLNFTWVTSFWGPDL